MNDSDELGRLCEVKYVVRQLICVAEYTNIHVESVELPFLSKKLRVDGEPKSVLNQKMRALRVENKERALSFHLRQMRRKEAEDDYRKMMRNNLGGGGSI